MTAQLTPQALEAISASGECTGPIFRMAHCEGNGAENLARSLAIHLNTIGFCGVTWEGLTDIARNALAATGEPS